MSTPFPAPSAPRVPAGCRVYAIGDIHGRPDLLGEMLALIEADGRGHGGRKVIVALGDYLDRGPDSRGVVDRLLAGPPPGFDMVALRGNHEQFLLDFLADPSILELWYMNGGEATLASYGLVGGSAEVLAAALRCTLPESHLRFLAALPYRHVEGDYAFVHAGVAPDRPWEAQRESDLLWIRHPFLTAATDFGRVIVHGHTITAEPQERPNRIGIDTGAYLTGRLTCLALEEDRRWFLRT